MTLKLICKKIARNTLPEYHVWKRMRNRCTNKNNPRYADWGGRGITVCKEWDDFEIFYRDLGPRPTPEHSLERKDNNKGYYKENCCWANKQEQSENRRNVKFVTWNGKTQTLKKWAVELDLPYDTIIKRYRRGLSPEQILSKRKFVL